MVGWEGGAMVTGSGREQQVRGAERVMRGCEWELHIRNRRGGGGEHINGGWVGALFSLLAP